MLSFVHINVVGPGVQVSRTGYTNLSIADLRAGLKKKYPETRVRITKGRMPRIKGMTAQEVVEAYDPDTNTMIVTKDGETIPTPFDILII